MYSATAKTFRWEIYYQNTNDQLTEKFYNLIKRYEDENFKLDYPIIRLKGEPAQVRLNGRMSNVDVILLFRRIFQENREYKEGCTRFNASSTLIVTEGINMMPLLEIF